MRRILFALIVCLVALATRSASAGEGSDDTWSFLRVFRVAEPRIIGVRAQWLETRNAGDAKGISLAFASRYYSDSAISVRFLQSAHIGRSRGFDGGLDMDVAIGRRFDLNREVMRHATAAHGPFIRGGARGFIRGNDDFLGSYFEAPTVQLGYQYMEAPQGLARLFGLGKPTVAELAFHGGLALAGRFKMDDYARNVRVAPAYGVHAALVLGWLDLQAAVTRASPGGGAIRTNVDMAEASVCVRAGQLAICSDLRHYATGMETPAVDYRRELFWIGGLTVGYGS
jgi:hypothetical protein